MLSVAVLVATLVMGDTSWAGRNVSNSELLNQKRGRVVDAATGTGIPDAKIIAMWDGASQSIAGASGGCVLQRIVTTDAKGDFVIPKVAGDLDLSGRGTKGIEPFTARVVDYKWTLVVFKPGFVREGDLDSFDLNRGDPSLAGFAWESIPPSVNNEMKIVRIKDIRMEKAEMSFERTVWYYAGLKQATSCGRTELEQAEIRGIREAIARFVEPMPCSLPPETSVKAEVAMAFSGLFNDDKFNERMKTEGQEKWPWTNTAAGALCRALGARGKTQ